MARIEPSTAELPSRDEVSPVTRRTVMGVAGVAAGAVLAGCGGDGDSDAGGPYGGNPGGDASKTGDQQPDPDGGAEGLARTSEIPVGGGKVFKDEKVVVTQPEEGEFKAFSAVCTHRGCTVRDVKGGTINCPCHGSKYAIADGSVENGPATNALPGKTVTVDGDSLSVS